MKAILADPSRPIVAATLAAALAFLAWPVPAGVEPVLFRAAAVIVTAVGLWGTHALPEHLTSLIVMVATVLLGVAPPEVAFSGFATGGAWLLFSGIVIGLGISESGLGQRMAEVVLARIRPSYGGVIAGLVTIGVALAFVMPSTIPRIVILMPITLALADRLGFEDGSRGRTGMALATGAGTFLPTFAILPSNLPNVVLAGSAEAVLGVTPTYAEYALYHIPVTGVLRAGALILVLAWMFRDAPRPVESVRRRAPLDPRQRRMLAVMAATLAFWFTDFIHHVQPAWVGLAAAIVIMLPATGLLEPSAFRDKANMGPFFFVGGILGMGAIMTHSGLDEVLSGRLIALLDPRPGADAANYAAIIGISMVMSLVMTAPGSPVVLAPLAGTLADATGLPVMTVLMTELVGLSSVVFPYQGPPLVVTIALSGIRVADALRLTLAMAAVMILALAPINYLWWRVIGLFG